MDEVKGTSGPGIKVTRENGEVIIIPFKDHVNEWSLNHVRSEEPTSTVELCEWDTTNINMDKKTIWIADFMGDVQ